MAIPVDSGKEYLIWSFDFALATFYEVDTMLVQPLLPRRLAAVEIAPGVSLINITCFNFPEGALGSLPEFQELIFGVVVSPDLSRGVPQFATHIVSLASTSQEHLNHSEEYYKLPSFGQLSNVEIMKEKLEVEYEDSRGKILAMKNCASNIVSKEGESYFQVYTSADDALYIGDVYIKAPLCEHQESGDAGELFNHPFFREFDVEEADPLAYLQIVGEPGKKGQQYYFRPEKFS